MTTAAKAGFVLYLQDSDLYKPQCILVAWKFAPISIFLSSSTTFLPNCYTISHKKFSSKCLSCRKLQSEGCANVGFSYDDPRFRQGRSKVPRLGQSFLIQLPPGRSLSHSFHLRAAVKKHGVCSNQFGRGSDRRDRGGFCDRTLSKATSLRCDRCVANGASTPSRWR